MSAQLWDRLGALAGVVAVILFAVAAGVPGTPPDLDASGTKLLDDFADKDTRFLTAGYLNALALPFVIWFAVTLRARLSAGKSGIAGVAFGGAVAAAALTSAGAAVVSVIAMEADNGLAPDAARVLWVLSNTVGIGACAFALGTFVGGIAIASLRTGAFPAWLGWIGVVLGAAFLVPALAIASDADWVMYVAFPMFAALGVWILVHSALLLRDSMKAA